MERALNLQSAPSVRDIFHAGAEANRRAACRVGSIDRITAPGSLIATGDLHDNPVHFSKLVAAAGLSPSDPAPGLAPPVHLVLHEIIHPDKLINGMDFSYRALAKVAALKAEFPERVHVLLGNHELAQMIGAAIVKDGVRSLDVFHAGLDYAFGSEAEGVFEALCVFVRSMPIALRCVTPRGDILVAHSVPAAAMMARFDASILSRELTDADYEPRRGSAYLMVWGRGYDAELLEDLVERWGVNLFVLGHEHVESGAMLVPPNALVLNSDHARGVYVPIDLSNPPRAEEAVARAVALS